MYPVIDHQLRLAVARDAGERRLVEARRSRLLRQLARRDQIGR